MLWKNVKNELPKPDNQTRVRCIETGRVCYGIYKPADDNKFQIIDSPELSFENYRLVYVTE